jgi:hypothetical protein
VSAERVKVIATSTAFPVLDHVGDAASFDSRTSAASPSTKTTTPSNTTTTFTKDRLNNVLFEDNANVDSLWLEEDHDLPVVLAVSGPQNPRGPQDCLTTLGSNATLSRGSNIAIDELSTSVNQIPG